MTDTGGEINWKVCYGGWCGEKAFGLNAGSLGYSHVFHYAHALGAHFPYSERQSMSFWPFDSAQDKLREESRDVQMLQHDNFRIGTNAKEPHRKVKRMVAVEGLEPPTLRI